MTNLILSIGLNDKDTKKQEVDTLTAINTIADVIGDCSIVNGMGVFTHADGTRVIEPCLIVTAFNKTIAESTCDIKKLNMLLNQECIACQEDNREAVFI